jgi:hypothetical protein
MRGSPAVSERHHAADYEGSQRAQLFRQARRLEARGASRQMKNGYIGKALRFAGAGATVTYLFCLPGCGSPDTASPETSATSDDQIASVEQKETPAQCNSDLATCIQNAKNIFDLFSCQATYATCLTTNITPPIVTTTVNSLDQCRTKLTTCTTAAKTPGDLAKCQVDAVTCTATAFAAPIATTVAGAVSCIDGAAQCAGKATSAQDIAACGTTFTKCAEEAATAVLPPIVVSTVDGVADCTAALGTCIAAAKTPADVTACNGTEVTCVGKALGVTIPNPAGAVSCAETAATCVNAARSIDDLNACTTGLTKCVANLAAPVNCDVAFTQCFAKNPFNIFQCADDNRKCHAAAGG